MRTKENNSRLSLRSPRVPLGLGADSQFQVSSFPPRRICLWHDKFQVSNTAFTLIEVMAATAILVIIVLIMSTVFHQSSVAWDAGTRKAEGNMMGRAALGFMAREMEGAVAEPDILTESIINDGANSITFITLGGEVCSTQRVARKITYGLTASETIRRLEQTMPAGAGYGGAWVAKSADLVTNVSKLAFYTADGTNHMTNLPAWVRIEMGLRRRYDVSGVGARSAGPNKVIGDGDDIKSW